MSDSLLLALGEADANMYLCSKEKDLRPSKKKRTHYQCGVYLTGSLGPLHGRLLGRSL